MSLHVLVVDDEPLAREGLRMLLSEDKIVSRITEARNGNEAVAAIREDRPNLVFLDIQMPMLDGFGVVDKVGAKNMPPVIFVTAHDHYAVAAFEVNAIDYLLKPVTAKRFQDAFTRAKDRIANPKKPLDRIAVRSGDRTRFVPVIDIEWIAAAENYVELHTDDGTHLLHVPLQTLAAALDPDHFVRIHRSTIVNMCSIKEIRPATHGQYVIELISGVRLRSGRTYHDQIRALMSNPF
ncbi:MAG: response regulator transcription factor [Acidobacteria bacterium]|nr:response regulator transcription factor [Acidobacteriota bacterium]